MAKGFVPSAYFKKISTTSLLADFYQVHNIPGFDPIPETTPKKDAVRIMTEFYQSLDPAVKIDLEPTLIQIAKLSTKTGARILTLLATEQGIAMDLSEFVTANQADKVLYYGTHHEELLTDALFLTEFYELRGYYTYPSPHKEIVELESKLLSLQNEFETILRKETRGRFSFIETKEFDGRFHLLVSFEDYPKLTPSVNFKEGVLDRTTTSRPVKDIYFIYHPDRNEIDIKSSGSKKDRDLYLETVLRIMFETQLDTKEHLYNVEGFKDPNFTLSIQSVRSDLLSWRLQSLSLLILATKQTLRLTAPKGRSVADGTADMWEILSSLNLSEKMGGIELKGVGLTFKFADTTNEKGVLAVNCSITPTSCSLGNMSSQERLTKQVLKDSGIDLGFMEVVAQ